MSNAPPSFTQQVTFLYTRDLPATTRFYEELLGLPLVLNQGGCRIYRVAADAFVGFCASEAAAAPPAERRTVIVTLVSDAVDEWYRWLSARGVVFEKTPALNEQFNIYHCFLRDPNGYLLEIQRFLDPAWPPPLDAPPTST